jgi:hypothetical protein
MWSSNEELFELGGFAEDEENLHWGDDEEDLEDDEDLDDNLEDDDWEPSDEEEGDEELGFSVPEEEDEWN